jgi:hypothetical protein
VLRGHPQAFIGESLEGLSRYVLPPLAVDTERAHEAHPFGEAEQIAGGRRLRRAPLPRFGVA